MNNGRGSSIFGIIFFLVVIILVAVILMNARGGVALGGTLFNGFGSVVNSFIGTPGSDSGNSSSVSYTPTMGGTAGTVTA